MYNFKTLTGSSKFLSYKDWKIGDYVIGQVIRFQQNSKNPKVQDAIVKVIDTNIKDEKVNLKKDDTFTVNGTTALQKALDAGVEEEDILKVVYLGKEEIKSGQWKGSKANKLEVAVAPAQDKAKFENTEAADDELI